MIPQLINLLIYLVVVGLILGIVLWVNDTVPVPAPFHNIIRIVSIVVAAIILILLLLQLIGVDVGRVPVVVSQLSMEHSFGSAGYGHIMR